MIVYTERRPGESDDEWERRLQAHRAQVRENEARLLAAREAQRKRVGKPQERRAV